MGPTWVLSAPDGPHVGSVNFAVRECFVCAVDSALSTTAQLHHYVNHSAQSKQVVISLVQWLYPDSQCWGHQRLAIRDCDSIVSAMRSDGEQLLLSLYEWWSMHAGICDMISKLLDNFTLSGLINHNIIMALAQMAVTPLLMHWSCLSVALLHHYNAFDLVHYTVQTPVTH